MKTQDEIYQFFMEIAPGTVFQYRTAIGRIIFATFEELISIEPESHEYIRLKNIAVKAKNAYHTFTGREFQENPDRPRIIRDPIAHLNLASDIEFLNVALDWEYKAVLRDWEKQHQSDLVDML